MIEEAGRQNDGETVSIDDLSKELGIKIVSEVIPEPEELEAIREGREDRTLNVTISHEAIN